MTLDYRATVIVRGIAPDDERVHEYTDRIAAENLDEMDWAVSEKIDDLSYLARCDGNVVIGWDVIEETPE